MSGKPIEFGELEEPAKNTGFTTYWLHDVDLTHN
jgi:hypothetical protein